MLIMSLLFISISSLILMINLLISIKLSKSREKISPFECGFDPISKSRLPFSIQFFLISLIFLIFDIEITLLIPLIFMMFFLNKIMLMTSLLFLLMLTLGLMIEYLEQSIDWKK
uniref:NADH dehydrogenase subunit 3 n=1 Tax=Lepisiota frauenfeldi TaxID=610729 RepID=UPI001FA7FE86|nr:NADH dehydrogenase subunit 3 [Lepisiota frauenfeldi]ULM64015.1 NADH dehydrogenase subunit 3 [Lepisiota frauenfeldi]ULM64028.1 NADH dehydrogenase subunit 3 [Lepisiota frauenfeldi]WEY05523.1 NADH dehydrogenase subunit 3 [Lepisiota frauenfeldi]WEY05536.1 NADH dehydrogenase subunit 3 [Lepisiota frauenfeldi]WEY05549.1 NADH dehydrogenase subunit 3 [Lepisiota frauenfeldi]